MGVSAVWIELQGSFELSLSFLRVPVIPEYGKAEYSMLRPDRHRFRRPFARLLSLGGNIPPACLQKAQTSDRRSRVPHRRAHSSDLFQSPVGNMKRRCRLPAASF